MVSIFPDDVVSVIYQTIAYCTREEPNRDMVWAVKNRKVLPFHVFRFISCYLFLVNNNVNQHGFRHNIYSLNSKKAEDMIRPLPVSQNRIQNKTGFTGKQVHK